MSARAAFRFAAALAAVAASPACEFVHPLDVDPDVVSVAIMLVAGEREARLLAVHPTYAHQWPGPLRCLRAVLPQEIRGGGEYEIEGTAPLGAFSGKVVLPAAPVLIEPGDSLHLPGPTEYEFHPIPIRYRIGSDVGTLLADVLDAFRTEEDGMETELDMGYVASEPLEGAEADTIFFFYQDRPLRFSLRLLGIGWNYTNFLENEGLFPLPRPWPGFGIEGEGVYGYFDGIVPSRVSKVWVR